MDGDSGTYCKLTSTMHKLRRWQRSWCPVPQASAEPKAGSASINGTKSVT